MAVTQSISLKPSDQDRTIQILISILY